MTKEDIKLKKPKSCNHCAAMRATDCCSLRYKTEIVPYEEWRIWAHFTTWEDAVIKLKPAEPCPKPKNIKECVAIREVIDIHRHSRVNSPEYNAMNYQNMTKEESLKHYLNLKKDDL